MMLTPDPSGAPSIRRFTTTFNDQPFSLDVDRTLAAGDDEAMTAADDAMHWLGDNLLALTAACADELLSLYNDEWAEGDEGLGVDDELPLGADRFRQRLHARALMLMADGTVRVVFDDDGMFSDHAVVLETDTERTPIEVFLEG